MTADLKDVEVAKALGWTDITLARNDRQYIGLAPREQQDLIDVKFAVPSYQSELGLGQLLRELEDRGMAKIHLDKIGEGWCCSIWYKGHYASCGLVTPQRTMALAVCSTVIQLRPGDIDNGQ